jgi:6-pyruvoyltetrahydropterin/6-carboxytetrahydropterin synthase
LTAAAQPVATLGRRYHLSASHRLHTEALSEQANRNTFGKCNNPFGHGHNYVVEVRFAGPVDTETGMVVDLGALDAFARTEVLERFDLQNLNTLAIFGDTVPTTENFAVALHGIFAAFRDAHSPSAVLTHVHVEETANNGFDFSGGGLPAAGRT